MVNKRDTSKQKRARENRAQRDARKARTEAASTPRPSRQAPTTRSSRTASSGSKRGAAASTSDRPARPARPPRAGDVAVDVETLEGNWYSKRLHVPGGRQVLTGAVLTIVLTATTVFQKLPEAHTAKGAKVKYTRTIGDVYGWKAVPLLALPVIAALLAAYFILSPNRRRIWIACSAVATIGVATLGIPYIFPVGFLVYAVMRSNKIEGPPPGSRAARAMDEADDQTDDDASSGEFDEDDSAGS